MLRLAKMGDMGTIGRMGTKIRGGFRPLGHKGLGGNNEIYEFYALYEINEFNEFYAINALYEFHAINALQSRGGGVVMGKAEG
jgi:hypothetical protein